MVKERYLNISLKGNCVAALLFIMAEGERIKNEKALNKAIQEADEEKKLKLKQTGNLLMQKLKCNMILEKISLTLYYMVQVWQLIRKTK